MEACIGWGSTLLALAVYYCVHQLGYILNMRKITGSLLSLYYHVLVVINLLAVYMSCIVNSSCVSCLVTGQGGHST